MVRMNSKLELLTHPVRLRIVGALAGGESTVEQLSENLPDVSQATLYRHVQQLIDGEIVTVSSRKYARGGTQRVLQLAPQGGKLPSEEFESADDETLKRIFFTFFASTEANFWTYLSLPKKVPVDEGVVLRGETYFATREEARAVRDQIHEVLAEAARRPRTDKRRRWRASLVAMPLEMLESPL